MTADASLPQPSPAPKAPRPLRRTLDDVSGHFLERHPARSVGQSNDFAAMATSTPQHRQEATRWERYTCTSS